MHFRYVEATFLIWVFIYFKFIFTNFDVSILTLLLNEPLFDWGKIFFEESLAVGGMKLPISIIRLLQSRTDKNMKVNAKNPENA